VYVEAGGAAPRSAEEARAFLKWIDEFEVVLRAHNRRHGCNEFPLDNTAAGKDGHNSS
jgi:hypothetical protein